MRKQEWTIGEWMYKWMYECMKKYRKDTKREAEATKTLKKLIKSKKIKSNFPLWFQPGELRRWRTTPEGHRRLYRSSHGSQSGHTGQRHADGGHTVRHRRPTAHPSVAAVARRQRKWRHTDGTLPAPSCEPRTRLLPLCELNAGSHRTGPHCGQVGQLQGPAPDTGGDFSPGI